MQYFFGLKFEFSHLSLLNIVDDAILADRTGYVCALDGNNVATAIDNPAYKEILNGAIVNNVDSNWVTMMVNRIYDTNYEHYCSSDLFVDILNKKKYRQFFLGSRKDILDSLKEKLSLKYDTAIADMPFMELPFCKLDQFDYMGIAEKINAYSPDIIWVSLGAPKQEAFMQKLQPYLKKGVMFGVGAIFNFFSGLKEVERRAPQWLIRIKMEWLYRLLSNPKKQFGRCWKIVRILPKAYGFERKKRNNDI